MTQSTATSLLVIAAVAALAPILSELIKGVRIPSVLFELVLGMIVGPELLGWAQLDVFVKGLSTLGLAFLFFVAGYEIDFAELSGPPLVRATVGWGISLALGLAVGSVLLISGFVLSSLLIGLALTTTAIGTLHPMLRDRGLLDTGFGKYLVAAGAAGEFGPIVAVTVLLGADSPGTQATLLILFVVLAVAVALIASRPQPPRMVATLQKHLTTSTQLPVRIVILLITGMVLVATSLGLDLLLGAFAAGLIARLALRPEQAEAMQPKLESLGFGFLIPVFFIVTGMEFHVRALFDNPATTIRVPIYLALFVVVRGVQALPLYRGLLPLRQRGAMVLLLSTALPMVVVITQIGLDTHHMLETNATALVGAGMLSVLLFPMAGFALAGRADSAETGQATVTNESRS